eukprot:gb/GECG01012029.1/.p1 GENE.gb/GECG01012029.1/~~gb/GECG01012029.1/.p1  ORF type:complete len:1436 (+),score=140.98 gb/GECG01012029.1/:1-4308(+)
MNGNSGSTRQIQPTHHVSGDPSTNSFWLERANLMRAFPPPLPHRGESLQGPGFSNWIIQNHALVGQNPAVGGNCQTFVTNLDKLFSAGVTTIVCLQYEMSISHDVSKALVKTTEAALAQQVSRSSGELQAVVNVQPYFDRAEVMVQTGRYPQFDKNYRFQVLHFPMMPNELGISSDSEVMEWIYELLSHIRAGELLFIHCSDGNGRTGIIAAILLGCIYDMSSAEALDAVQRSRDCRHGAKGISPELHDQKLQVHRILSNREFRRKAAAVQPQDTKLKILGSYDGASTAITRLRHQLSQKGVASFLILQRLLKAEELDESKRLLTKNVLSSGLADFGFYISGEEFNSLWEKLSTTKENQRYVDSRSLCNEIRKPLNNTRTDAVKAAFQLMDVDMDGFVDLSDIANIFDASGHPDVRSNRRSEQQVLAEFLDTFPGARSSLTTVSGSKGLRLASNVSFSRHVDYRSFCDYYTDLSTAIEDDNYFTMMLWNCWPVRGRKSHPDESLLRARILTQARAQVKYDEETTAESLINAIKALLVEQDPLLAPGYIAELERLDGDGDGHVTPFEFVRATRNCGIREDKYSEGALMRLFQKLLQEGKDHTASQTLSLEKVRDAIKRPLNESRRRCVIAAFEMLLSQTNGAGLSSYSSRNLIPLEVIMGEFQTSGHPDVVSQHKAEQFVRDIFVRSIKAPSIGNVINFPKFQLFHELISGCLSDDAYFCSLIWGVWGVGHSTRYKNALQNKYQHGRSPSRSQATSEPSHVEQANSNAENFSFENLATQQEHANDIESYAAGTRASTHYCSRGGYGVGPATLAGVSVSPNRSDLCWQHEHEKSHEAFLQGQEVTTLPGNHPSRPPMAPGKTVNSAEDSFSFDSLQRRLHEEYAGQPKDRTGVDDPFSPYRQIRRNTGFRGNQSNKYQGTPWNSSDHMSELLNSSKSISTIPPNADLESIFETLCTTLISHERGRGLVSLFAFDNFMRQKGEIMPEAQLKMCLQEFGVPLPPGVFQKIVNACAVTRGTQEVHIDTFLDRLCFNWSSNREQFVQQSWTKLQKAYVQTHTRGTTRREDLIVPADTKIPWDYLLSSLDPKHHPDVVHGTRSEEEIVEEFRQTFPNGLSGRSSNGLVSWEEFSWYCRRFSTLFEKDVDFTFVIWNLWHLQNVETEDWRNRNDSQTSSANKGLREQYRGRTRTPHTGENKAKGLKGWGVETIGWDTRLSGVGVPQQHQQHVRSRKDITPDQVVNRLRNSLSSHGEFGVLKLWTGFHSRDFGFSTNERRPMGLITRQELKTTTAEFSLGISDFELDKLHNQFGGPHDFEHNISQHLFQYINLMTAILGSVSSRRENLIQQAWNKISGGAPQCPISLICQKLSMKQYPQVLRGSLTEGAAREYVLHPLRALSGAADDSASVPFSLFRMIHLAISLNAADDASFQWLMWNMYLSK